MVPLKCRHGAGLSPGDYINMYMEGKYATVVEKETRNNLKKSSSKEREDPPTFKVEGGEEVAFEEDGKKKSGRPKKLDVDSLNKFIVDSE